MSDAGSPQPNRGNITRLVARINEAHGVDLSSYRQPYLERRLAARMRVLGITSYRRYGDLLDSDPKEYAQLIDTLTINVTEFFRDAEMWGVLRRIVLPEIVERKSESRHRSIRVWSAGCATGEEPYSLAMMLLDVLGSEAARYSVSVLATDLDPGALARAKEGVYPMAKARRIPADYRLRFTRGAGQSHFVMSDEVRDMIQFRKSSLFDDTPVRVIDLVLCRNVFIYFDRGQQAKVLGSFTKAMSPGGYLVLGRSEKLADTVAKQIEPVNGAERIYRKRGR